MRVGIIDYGAGNLWSVASALRKLGCDVSLLQDPDQATHMDKIIFPGVGNARPAMHMLRKSGFDEYLKQTDRSVLAICLGMQLLYEGLEEGDVPGLGIIPGRVGRLPNSERWPHMGWNTMEVENQSKLLEGVIDKHVYFVHGYAAPVSQVTVARCNYGMPFTAALEYENFYGCQFHPEKSGDAGMQILKNFFRL